MNSLHRNLIKGDYVIIDKHTFVCDGEGFGAYVFTMGTALYGRFEGKEEHIRMSGMDIDKDQTLEKYAERNGWIHRFTGLEVTPE